MMNRTEESNVMRATKKKWAVALAGLALCFSAGGAIAGAQGDQPTDGGATAERVALDVSDGRVPVGDAEGVVRGVVDIEAMERMSVAAGDFLTARGVDLVDADGRSANVPALAVSDAVMDIEAVDVYGPTGKVVGRFGAGFIELDDYRARSNAAARLIEEATGTTYRIE